MTEERSCSQCFWCDVCNTYLTFCPCACKDQEAAEKRACEEIDRVIKGPEEAKRI